MGTVESVSKELSDNFVSLKVRLATNFMQLSTVRAIKNKMKVELKLVESKDEKTSSTKKGE